MLQLLSLNFNHVKEINDDLLCDNFFYERSVLIMMSHDSSYSSLFHDLFF